MFLLKKSVLNEYNAFFYHYSKTDISQAEQYQQKERANGDKLIFILIFQYSLIMSVITSEWSVVLYGLLVISQLHVVDIDFPPQCL